MCFPFRSIDEPTSAYIHSNSARLVTRAKFREKVRDRLLAIPELDGIVHAKPAELDAPRLLKLLADRSAKGFEGRDYLAAQACIRLTELGDFELLTKALAVDKSLDGGFILRKGFGNPRGRDFLLAKILDDREPMPARLGHVTLLYGTGGIYRSTFTEIGIATCRVVNGLDQSNVLYLQRIAQAAVGNRKHEDLCRALIECLGGFCRKEITDQLSPLAADAKDALALLRELYDTKPSQAVQFAIEYASVSIPDAYEKLKSPCGDFLSILRPMQPDRSTKLMKGGLHFEYAYKSILENRDDKVNPEIVLRNIKTRQSHVFPTSIRIGGGSEGNDTSSVVLPADFPPGRYEVLFQVRDGDKIISTGHHFVAEL